MMKEYFRFKVTGNADGKECICTGLFERSQDPVVLAYRREHELVKCDKIKVTVDTKPCIRNFVTMERHRNEPIQKGVQDRWLS